MRSLIATKLLEEYGLTQEEIAASMDLTQPAVSQYINGKRSSDEVKQKLENDPQVRILTEEAVSNAAKGEDYSEQLTEVLRTVRDKGLFSESFSGLEKL